MKSSPCFVLTIALVCASAVASASASASSVTPVTKVIQLLEGMAANGKKEKKAEQVQYASQKQFCSDESTAKKTAIDDAQEKIDSLKAGVEKNAATIARHTKAIAETEKDVATWTADTKAAKNVRELEKADFDKTYQDLSESIDAVGRAVALLKKQAQDTPQASSLLQVSALKNLALVPDSVKTSIDAFFQQEDEALSEAAADLALNSAEDAVQPAANAYESKSSGIVGELSSLGEQFTRQREASLKDEANAKNAYSLLTQNFADQIKQGNGDSSAKSKAKAKAAQAKSMQAGELSATIKTMGEDKKLRAKLVSSCQQKAAAFESRQQLRTEELEAVEKAVSIMQNKDNKLSFLAKENAGASSFPQLRVGVKSPAQVQTVAYLHKRAAQINSPILLALASQASSDPFKKISRMIKEMIVKLVQEASDEADQKGYCDGEMKTNKHTRQEKTNQVEALTAEIEEVKATVSKVGSELTELSAGVAEIDESLAQATSIRNEEKAKNKGTIKDAMAAQAAVDQALTVLRDFYQKAGDATDLIQETFQGQQAGGQGVIGMLEVIQSDFARLESDTTTGEETSQKQYEDLVDESKVDKTTKSVAIEAKTAKKQKMEQRLLTTQDDLSGTQKELDAALKYFEKLKPQCVDAGVSYQDTVQRRKEEIASLQEALTLLG